jgi:hypothetical protein
MTYNITVNINEHLENYYPNLKQSEIDLIAQDVHRRWDYTWLVDNIDRKVQETAKYANIKLSTHPLPFNTDRYADFSDNEMEGFPDPDENEGLVHSSEGC